MAWDTDNESNWKRYGAIEFDIVRCVNRRPGGGVGWKEFDVTFEIDGEPGTWTVQDATPEDAENFVVECLQRRYEGYTPEKKIVIKGTVEYHGKRPWE